MTRKSLTTGVALLVICSCAGVREVAAQQQGPLPPPPPGREVVRIPITPKAEPPPIPVEEIIRHFAQKEDEFLRALSGYTYRKTVRVQELDEDNKPAGEFQLVTEPAVASDGKPYEKVLQQQPSTLRRWTLEPEDLEILARVPPFPFTTGQLTKYDISYEGKQQVDEIPTYVFRVKPRLLERARAYFDGLVWVDDRDLLIVKTYGKWVTETGDVSSPSFPFSLFETYRENIDGKHWFPIYARSEDTLNLKSGQVPIRLIVRWTDYKPVVPPGAASTPSSRPQKPSAP